MFRVFAPEGESFRKYALIFRGISENWEGKNKKRLRFESCLYCFHLVSIKHRLFGRGAAYSDDINPRRFSTADVFIVQMSLRYPIKQRNRLHRVYVQVVSPFLYYNRVWVSYNLYPHCSVSQCHVFLLIGRTSILSRAPLSCARASSSVSAYCLRHSSACSDLWSAEHSGGEITLARVGQESNYRLVVQLLATGKLSRSPCRCTRRYACEQTFAARQQTCG